MTETVVRRRQGKKRCLATIFDAMFRRDAIFPEIRSETVGFAALIVMCNLMLADGKVHPLETRCLTRLVAPDIKLRRDDIEYICDRIQDEGMVKAHLDWLVTFMQSAMPPSERQHLASALEELARSDHLVHKAEVDVIVRVRRLLGLMPE